MWYEVLKSSSVQRLKSLLKNRYGKGLYVQFISEVASEQEFNQMMNLEEGTLRVPISVDNCYLATAIIPQVQNLSADEHKSISEMVKMVLEPACYSHFLSQKSQNSLAQQKVSTEHSTSVIPLFEGQLNDQTFTDFSQELIDAVTQARDALTKEPSSHYGEGINQTSSIFLHSTNPHRVQRVAVAIHDASSRWAYLRYEDIQNSIHSSQDLMTLGDVTVFVEDILNLSPASRMILIEYLKSMASIGTPFIIFASSTKFSDLVDQKMIESDFASVLEKHIVEVDRLPQELTLMKQALEMLLLAPGENFIL